MTPHQVLVALARGTAAFVDRPDDERLTTAHVARGEDAGEIGRELPVVGLDVGTGVGLEFELLHDLLLGSHDAHREEEKLHGDDTGAPLDQVNTGLVYRGPRLVREIEGMAVSG